MSLKYAALSMNDNCQLQQNKEHILKLLTAGSAILTIKSKRTGTHFTYQFKRSKKTDAYWVSLLRGPDNYNNYVFIGVLNSDTRLFHHSNKSTVHANAQSVQAIKWTLNILQTHPDYCIQNVEFYHEGLCCKCGRRLTTPESIALGVGPRCALSIM